MTPAQPPVVPAVARRVVATCHARCALRRVCWVSSITARDSARKFGYPLWCISRSARAAMRLPLFRRSAQTLRPQPITFPISPYSPRGPARQARSIRLEAIAGVQALVRRCLTVGARSGTAAAAAVGAPRAPKQLALPGGTSSFPRARSRAARGHAPAPPATRSRLYADRLFRTKAVTPGRLRLLLRRLSCPDPAASASGRCGPEGEARARCRGAVCAARRL
jgi:hypothetical protein